MLGVDITGSQYLERPACRKAASYAAAAHAGHFRKSGQPYVMHCIETAIITEQMLLHIFDADDLNNKRSEAAIVTAILHDIVDDTSRGLDDVEGIFGADVAKLVKTVSQLSRNTQLLRRMHRDLIAQGKYGQASGEIEAMKSMIVHMTEEPLVIIVKLADRLHNMRTIWALKPEKARYLAHETLEVWCPLCEYLGLGAVKAELQDICFAVLEPEKFSQMQHDFDALFRKRDQARSHAPGTRRQGSVGGEAAASSQSTTGSAEEVLWTFDEFGQAICQTKHGQTVMRIADLAHQQLVDAAACARRTQRMPDAAHAERRATHAAASTLATPAHAPAVAVAAPAGHAPASAAPAMPMTDLMEPALGAADIYNSAASMDLAEPARGPLCDGADNRGAARVHTHSAPEGLFELRDAMGVAGTDSVVDGATRSLEPSLTEEQRQTAARVQSVTPFHSNNFMTMHLDHSPKLKHPAMDFLKTASSNLMREISMEGVSAGSSIQIQGRIKSLYSTHKKMRSKRVPLCEVYDAVALRVVVSDSGDAQAKEAAVRACYRIRPLVNRLWRPVPKEYDDYIVAPKKSGYQSIHAAVHGPGGVPMEVQIRTSSMHYDAEYGAASHWAYKDRMKAAGAARPAVQGEQRAGAAADAAARSAAQEYSARAAVGQPVRCVMDGQIHDGIVVRADAEKQALIAAVTVACSSSSLQALPQAEYAAMLDRVQAAGWSEVGQRDNVLMLCAFFQAPDGQHYHVDRFGQANKYCTLAFVHAAPPPAAPACNAGGAGNPPRSAGTAQPKAQRARACDGSAASQDELQVIDSERVVQLRVALEWGDEANGSQSMPASKREWYQISNAEELLPRIQGAGPKAEGVADTPGERSGPRQIKVMVYPEGGLTHFPWGSTAGDVVDRYGRIQLESEVPSSGDKVQSNRTRLVNVNNQLVSEETMLADGDLVVPSDSLLSDV